MCALGSSSRDLGEIERLHQVLTICVLAIAKVLYTE